MKKVKNLLTIFALLLALNTSAQVLKQNTDGTYSILKTERTKSEAIPTGKFLKMADGELKPIFISKNKKYFVVMVSKKTQRKYNKYITL